MNFRTENCCRLCSKATKMEFVNILNVPELANSIKMVYNIEIDSASNLSTFICDDCRINAITFAVNYEKVQYIQGQLAKYARMQPTSSASASSTSSAKHASQSVSMVPQKMRKFPKPSRIASSPMIFKLGDRVRFLNIRTKTLVHGIIDGTFPNTGKYQIKTDNGELYNIRDSFILADGDNAN